jgi:hypothetical protein
MYISEAIRNAVRDRANNRCEYCAMPRHLVLPTFHIDHIVAEVHGGQLVLENLSYCCAHCNLHKGTNLSGIDPVSQRIVELFHPRKQAWKEHFAWNGPLIIGITDCGRATVATLKMNDDEWLALRSSLMDEGEFISAGS